MSAEARFGTLTLRPTDPVVQELVTAFDEPLVIIVRCHVTTPAFGAVLLTYENQQRGNLPTHPGPFPRQGYFYFLPQSAADAFVVPEGKTLYAVASGALFVPVSYQVWSVISEEGQAALLT